MRGRLPASSLATRTVARAISSMYRAPIHPNPRPAHHETPITYEEAMNSPEAALWQAAIQSEHEWPLEQMDVTAAFLNAPVDEDIYMDVPLGYKPATVLNASETSS